MTAKEFVLKHRPNSVCEKRFGFALMAKYPYFIVREKPSDLPYADGNTESNAWMNAKKAVKLELSNAHMPF